MKFEPRRGGGLRYTEWELLELSIVSVPANPAALIIERRLHRREADADDTAVYVGNCGRPLEAECGLLDPSECAVHGPAAAEGEARSLRRRIARMRDEAMMSDDRTN